MIFSGRCLHAGGRSADGCLTALSNDAISRVARRSPSICRSAPVSSGLHHVLQQAYGQAQDVTSNSDQAQEQIATLASPQQSIRLSLQVDVPQPRCQAHGSLDDLLGVADFKAKPLPDPTWITAWAQAVISCLPATQPDRLLKLLVLLSESPTSVMQHLNRTHSFESALWTACGRCFVVKHNASTHADIRADDQAAELQADGSAKTNMACVDALKAAGNLRQRHGMHPANSWTQPLLIGVANLIYSLCCDASSHKDEGQASLHEVSMLLTKTLQAVHQLSQPLPVGTAERLLFSATKHLPHLDAVQAAKVVSGLPRLVKYVPSVVPRLYLVMVNTFLKQLSIPPQATAHAPPSSVVQGATCDQELLQPHLSSIPQSQDTGPHAVPTSQTDPIDGWQLANWLHALTSKPFINLIHDYQGSNQYSDRIEHLWRVLKPRLLLAATPAALASSSPQDLLNILLGMARLSLRPSQDWIQDAIPVLHPRLFSKLQPRQFMLLTWAAAHLKLGTAVSPAWLHQLLLGSQGFMRHVDAPLRAQFAWSVAELARQQQQPVTDSSPEPEAVTQAEGNIPSDFSNTEVVMQWHVPLPWLQHLMLSSQASFRHSDAGTLSSLTCSIAQLIRPVLLASSSNDSSVDASDQASIKRTAFLELLLCWTEDMCAAFMRRVPVAGARPLSSMLDGLSHIIAVVKEAYDTNARVSSWLHRNEGSFAALYAAGLGQLSEIAQQHKQSVNMKDISVSLTAAARIRTIISLQLPTAQIQQLISLASRMALTRQPSAETATDLASIILALPALPMTSQTGNYSNSNGHDIGRQSALQVRPTAMRQHSLFPDLELHAALLSHLPMAHASSIAAVWLALVRLRVTPDAELAQILLLSSHRRMQAMQPKHIAHMLHAMATWGIKPNDKWLDRMQLVVFRLHQQKQLLPRQRALVLWASAKAGWPLHREFMMALAPSARWLQHMPLHDIAMAAWSVCKLGVCPGTPWLMMALMQTAKQMSAMNSQAGNHSLQTDTTDESHQSPAAPGVHGQMQSGTVVLDDVGSHPSNNVRHLLMLASTFGGWGVSAPHWWWTAWLRSIQSAGHTLDLYACSCVMRVIARYRPHLMSTASHHSDVAAALVDVQDAIVARVSKLLQQSNTVRPHAVATLLWAVAYCIYKDALLDPRPPSDVSLLCCKDIQDMLKGLVDVWPSVSARSQSAYLLAAAGAVCRLAEHGCTAFTSASMLVAVALPQGSTASDEHANSSCSSCLQLPTVEMGGEGSQPLQKPHVIISDVWRRQLVCMLESRQVSFDTGQQHQAAVVLKFMEGFDS